MNEPRLPENQADPSLKVTDWYNYMAAYLKSVDPNHMVSPH